MILRSLTNIQTLDNDGAVIAMVKNNSSLSRLIPTLSTSKSNNPEQRQLNTISRFAMAVGINDVTKKITGVTHYLKFFCHGHG
jgi:hypothetical protein